METMVIAYVFAWAAVTLYLTWLAVQNRRLWCRLEEHQRRTRAGTNESRHSARAA